MRREERRRKKRKRREERRRIGKGSEGKRSGQKRKRRGVCYSSVTVIIYVIEYCLLLVLLTSLRQALMQPRLASDSVSSR